MLNTEWFLPHLFVGLDTHQSVQPTLGFCGA